MVQMNWDSFYELLKDYRDDVRILTFSELLELKDKLRDVSDDVQSLIDNFYIDEI